MVAVMGASGRVGGRIAELLLESGEKVFALGRSAEKLAGVAGTGATVRTGDAGDARFLKEAFRGADAAFTLLPPDVHAADYATTGRARGGHRGRHQRQRGAYVVFLSASAPISPRARGVLPACTHRSGGTAVIWCLCRY
jgi:uncharacterized protein YbjT (DUF2867 family)